MAKEVIFHAPDSQYWDIHEKKPLEAPAAVKGETVQNQAILVPDLTTGELVEKRRLMRTSANFRLGMSPDDFEYIEGISITVPDQAMSVPDLIARHNRGQSVKMRQPIYSDDEFPDLKTLDIAERQELAEQTNDFIKNTRSDLQKAEDMKRKKESDAKNKKIDGTSDGPKPSE